MKRVYLEMRMYCMPSAESKGAWNLERNLEKFCDSGLGNRQWQEYRVIRIVE